MQRHFAIALHDVSPNSHYLCERMIAMVTEVLPHAPVTLLIIPHHHARCRIDHMPAWRRWIESRMQSGDELSLHGYWHWDTGPAPRGPAEWVRRRVLTSREAEFSTLSSATARERIDKGLQLFRRCNWQPAGFVPPAWQISKQARHVLSEFSFLYTTNSGHIESICGTKRWAAPALSFSVRSSVRRGLSQAWLKLWMTLHRDAPFVRLALHPTDGEFPRLMKAWRKVLAMMAAERVVATKAQWIRMAS